MHVVRWLVGIVLLVLFLLHWAFFENTLYWYYADLIEVATTYANFGRVKNVKLRYPEDTCFACPKDQLVPKIIHHILLQEDDTFERDDTAPETCERLHRSEDGWQHWLWTSDMATEWVATQYPALKDNYTSYEQTIQRSNILRYLLVHHYGGIYLDMDISCREPLDNLLHIPFLTSSTSKRAVGVNNAFILARPRHPFLDELVRDRISSAYRVWPSPWFEAMITTGYMFLSNAWMEYVEQHKHRKYEDSVFLLVNGDGKYKEYALGGKVTTPLFTHGSANGWHRPDAKIILFAEKHPILVAATMVLIAIAWLGSMFHALCGCPGRRRWRARKAEYANAVADREHWAQAVREVDRQESNPETAPKTAQPQSQDPFRAALMSRLLSSMAPRHPQGLLPTRAASLRGSDDSISPIALPVRTASFAMSHPPSHARTSSLMPPSRDPYSGRPSSIYDYAYH